MAKKVSKFFRIGVEGDTCDGRVISAQDIPDLSLPAVCGIGSMLGIAGYQVIEIAIQRRFKGRGKP